MVNFLNVIQSNNLVHEDIIKYLKKDLRSHKKLLNISESHLTDIFKDPYAYLVYFSRVLHPEDQQKISELNNQYNPKLIKKRKEAEKARQAKKEELMKKIEKKKIQKKASEYKKKTNYKKKYSK